MSKRGDDKSTQIVTWPEKVHLVLFAISHKEEKEDIEWSQEATTTTKKIKADKGMGFFLS